MNEQLVSHTLSSSKETPQFAQFATLRLNGNAQEIREGRHLPNGGMDEVAWRSRRRQRGLALRVLVSDFHVSRWTFPKMGVPQNHGFQYGWIYFNI